jgi:membrane protease YdiL (CAAX protease family)
MTDALQKPRTRLGNFIVTCGIAIALAFLINIMFGARPLLTIALEGKPLAEQIGWGIALALAVGIPMWAAIVLMPIFVSLRNQLIGLISRVDISGLNPLWIALLAGSGEEILFRGAVQPIAGLWWTSLIFVLLHYRTYQFRSMTWQKAICAAAVFLISLFLGCIFLTLGLIAAIAAHATLDGVGLLIVRRLVREYATCA